MQLRSNTAAICYKIQSRRDKQHTYEDIKCALYIHGADTKVNLNLKPVVAVQMQGQRTQYSGMVSGDSA